MILKILLLFLLFFPSIVFAYPINPTQRQNVIKETLERFESNPQNKFTVKENNPIYPGSLTADYSSRRKKEIKKVLDFLEGKIYLSLNWYRYHLGYKEFLDLDVLDEEFGWIKGYYVKLGYRSDKNLGELWEKPFFEIYFRNFDDCITYKGRAGSYDIQFSTKAEIQRFGGKFGGYRNLKEDLGLYGYLDIGRRVWFRGENAYLTFSGIPGTVVAYKEKYRWLYFGGGAGIEYLGIQNASLGIDFELMGTPFKKYRKMYAYSIDSLTAKDFTLGSVWGLELNIPIKYYLLKNLSLDFTPFYIFWSIDESDVIEGYIEPESKSKIYGISCGFTISF